MCLPLSSLVCVGASDWSGTEDAASACAASSSGSPVATGAPVITLSSSVSTGNLLHPDDVERHPRASSLTPGVARGGPSPPSPSPGCGVSAPPEATDAVYAGSLAVN